MRTTLDIDEDVLLAAKQRARREGRSAGEVLSELARKGLIGPAASSQVGEPESFCGFSPLPNRGVAITNALIDELREADGK